MGKRAVGALVAGIFVVGACSGGSKSTAPPTTAGSTAAAQTSTTVPRSTTTTSTPEYSFDNSVPPPKLINTGTDYVAILKSLGRYGNWAGAHHPDPAFAATIIAPRTQLLSDFARDLTRLRDNRKRLIEELGDGASQYTILSTNPTAFSARVVEDIRVHYTVVANGRVTSRDPYAGPTTYLMLVVLVAGHWYFAAVDIQQPTQTHL